MPILCSDIYTEARRVDLGRRSRMMEIETADIPASPMPRVHLASRSPRRRELLNGAGIEHDAAHPGLDDGELAPGGVTPEAWVTALAYLKAKSALDSGTVKAPIVIGADTVVVHNGQLIGQPRDEAHARWMLEELSHADHDVLTGVALVDALTGRRRLFVDRAHVRVGALTDTEIETYLATGEWHGKAGAYNLSERIAAGWPITFDGDPGTIMGLPITALKAELAQFALGL